MPNGAKGRIPAEFTWEAWGMRQENSVKAWHWMAKAYPMAWAWRNLPSLDSDPCFMKTFHSNPVMNDSLWDPLVAQQSWGQGSRETWKLKICFDLMITDPSPNFTQHQAEVFVTHLLMPEWKLPPGFSLLFTDTQEQSHWVMVWSMNPWKQSVTEG